METHQYSDALEGGKSEPHVPASGGLKKKGKPVQRHMDNLESQTSSELHQVNRV